MSDNEQTLETRKIIFDMAYEKITKFLFLDGDLKNI